MTWPAGQRQQMPRPSGATRCRQAGLTLLELILGLAVFAVVAVLAAQPIGAILGGAAAVREQIELDDEIYYALQRIALEVRQAEPEVECDGDDTIKIDDRKFTAGDEALTIEIEEESEETVELVNIGSEGFQALGAESIELECESDSGADLFKVTITIEYEDGENEDYPLIVHPRN